MNILGELLADFFQIGLFSIGGGYAVIPLIQEHVVEMRGWLTMGEFTDIITISQMTPGPLAVNTSTFVGLQVGGVAGAVTATLGCVLSGFVISLILCQCFDRYKKSPYGQMILKSLKAASVGLILSAAATILILTFSSSSEAAVSGGAAEKLLGMMRGVNGKAVAIFLGAMILIRKGKVNPMAVMIGCGVVGGVVYG